MRIILTIAFVLMVCASVTGQPSPGDLYREYTWYNEVEDCDGALRVGGKIDYKEGPKYDYFQHDIPVPDLHVFQQGENILKTGKTPLYHGQMVHGVEVQWPGIMLLLKYDRNKTQ
ncbi:MAG: hypothetical protein V2B15_13065 [Bacteroidota bacterium]